MLVWILWIYRLLRVFSGLNDWLWRGYWLFFLLLPSLFLVLCLDPPFDVYLVSWKTELARGKTQSALIHVKDCIEALEKCITYLDYLRSAILVISHQQPAVFLTLNRNVIHQVTHRHSEEMVFNL